MATTEEKVASGGFGPERLTVWLGIIAAIGGPLYALGLVVLSLQVRETYRTDWSAAWYAAVLAPLEAIIAVGITQVQHGWPFLLLSSFLALYFAANYRARFQQSVAPAPPSPSFRRVRLTLNVAIIVGLIAVLALAIYRSTSWQQVTFLIAQFAFGIAIAVGAALAVSRGWSVLATAAGIFGAFCLALLITATINADLGRPPLPTIELPLANGTIVRGDLVSHSSGYWHVLTTPDGALVSYKDDEAKSVTIVPRPSRATPTVHP